MVTVLAPGHRDMGLERDPSQFFPIAFPSGRSSLSGPLLDSPLFLPCLHIVHTYPLHRQWVHHYHHNTTNFQYQNQGSLWSFKVTTIIPIPGYARSGRCPHSPPITAVGKPVLNQKISLHLIDCQLHQLLIMDLGIEKQVRQIVKQTLRENTFPSSLLVSTSLQTFSLPPFLVSNPFATCYIQSLQ